MLGAAGPRGISNLIMMKANGWAMRPGVATRPNHAARPGSHRVPVLCITRNPLLVVPSMVNQGDALHRHVSITPACSHLFGCKFTAALNPCKAAGCTPAQSHLPFTSRVQGCARGLLHPPEGCGKKPRRGKSWGGPTRLVSAGRGCLEALITGTPRARVPLDLSAVRGAIELAPSCDLIPGMEL